MLRKLSSIKYTLIPLTSRYYFTYFLTETTDKSVFLYFFVTIIDGENERSLLLLR